MIGVGDSELERSQAQACRRSRHWLMFSQVSQVQSQARKLEDIHHHGSILQLTLACQ